jgi:predicted nuclease with TOPRIM domain
MEVFQVDVISVLVGTGGAILAKLIFDLFTVKKNSDLAVVQIQFDAIRKERADMALHQNRTTNELQKQIFDLHSQIIALQKINFQSVQENADLKAQVNALTAENNELRKRIVELELEVAQLRGATTNAPDSHGSV